MHGIISILLNLVKYVLWDSIWSILENVLCTVEKNVYSDVVGWNTLSMFIKSTGVIQFYYFFADFLSN